MRFCFMMDFPCVQWQDHVALKWTGLDPERKEHFTSQLEIDDVFKYALTLTTQDDLDFVQSISAGYTVHKDTDKAAKCREKGNCSFKTRDYTAAALHYSQGVCFAPQSSEQLSLCYANRSAALYHLQHYQECLHDIDKALKKGYPTHLHHKLQERRTQCLKHPPAGQKAKEEHLSSDLKSREGSDGEGPLTFGIHPGAAVGFSLERGRHLVAEDRIAAGEVVLTDRPYSCVLIPGMEEVKGSGVRQDREREELFGTEHRRCHRCLAETRCPVPCDGCSYSRYCSTSCQRDAWEEHHRWECPLGADLMVMGVMMQLALRVTLKAGLESVQMAREPIRDKQPKSDPRGSTTPCHTSYYGDSYPSVFHLLHHLDDHSPALRFLCAVSVATLHLKLSKEGPLPACWDLGGPSAGSSQSQDEEGGIADRRSKLRLLGSTALRHVLQLRCNAQAVVTLQDTGAANSAVQSSREIRIATAIFPTLSVLNHSCCPNTSLVFSTGTGPGPSSSDLSAHLSESEAEDSSSARGVTLTVRAANVITSGQEILHCYGPHSSRMATQERQRLLQEQYYFLCQCEACTLQEEEEEGTEGRQQCSGRHESGLLCGKCKASLKTSSEDGGFMCSQSTCGHRMSACEVSDSLQGIRVHLEKAVDLTERDSPDEALRLLRRTQGQSGLVLAETHPLQGELEDATARAFATMGDWNKAASHLERSAVAIGSQYGGDSIELGRQLFKLAQLHFNGGARGPALAVIPKVRHLLCLHCGPRCQELEELRAMEDCLRG